MALIYKLNYKKNKYEITLVFTMHKESGNCNATALYNLIEDIGPEIIFEELTHQHFFECYEKESSITLETSAVKKYLKNYTIPHIAVDDYPRPQLYDEDVDRLYEIIFSRPMLEECRELRILFEQYTISVQKHGFSYLNGHANDEYFEQFDSLKGKIVDILNDEKLHGTRRLEKETIAKREDRLIKNIYNFSRTRPYKKALIMMGSGHRKSFLQLIKETKMPDGIQINWKIYFK